MEWWWNVYGFFSLTNQVWTTGIEVTRGWYLRIVMSFTVRSFITKNGISSLSPTNIIFFFRVKKKQEEIWDASHLHCIACACLLLHNPYENLFWNKIIVIKQSVQRTFSADFVAFCPYSYGHGVSDCHERQSVCWYCWPVQHWCVAAQVRNFLVHFVVVLKLSQN